MGWGGFKTKRVECLAGWLAEGRLKAVAGWKLAGSEAGRQSRQTSTANKLGLD